MNAYRKSRHFSSLVLVIILLVVLISGIIPVDAAATALTVAYIDVGQGDSIWIHDSNNFDILIDGGDTDAGPAVLAYLRLHNIDDIDVMVLTHPDSDHMGGLIDVLNADIPVEAIYHNGYIGSGDIWDEFAAAVTTEGLTLIAAQYPAEFSWGSTSAAILNPLSGLVDPNKNDASVVVRLTHGDINFLFTGDISSTTENGILGRGSTVAAPILKVAHHGSGSSSNTAFLAAVDPLEAIISVGEGNTYGHPSEETLTRLLAAGATIWRTDQQGTIVVTSDGTNYTIAAETIPTLVFLPLVIRTAPPLEPPGNIVITTVFYDGSMPNDADEYVEIRNNDSRSIQLEGWTLRDAVSHVFTFPNFLMAPAQICRVYTNENHPETCGFNYGSGTGIWNNDHDHAYLRDGSSTLVDEYIY
jgi:competence protein ComEC